MRIRMCIYSLQRISSRNCHVNAQLTRTPKLRSVEAGKKKNFIHKLHTHHGAAFKWIFPCVFDFIPQCIFTMGIRLLNLCKNFSFVLGDRARGKKCKTSKTLRMKKKKFRNRKREWKSFTCFMQLPIATMCFAFK